MTNRLLNLGSLRWAVPAISLIVFSVSQYQNWLWGWQIQMLLALFSVVAGLVLLANGMFSWGKFVVSALLGIIATYSFANGGLFWPIGLLILFVTAKGRKDRVVPKTSRLSRCWLRFRRAGQMRR